MHTHMHTLIRTAMHGYKSARHRDAPTLTHAYYTRGSREFKTPTISGVKVEKMLIEVDVQMRDVCFFGEQGFAALGCVGRYTLCSR